MLQTLTPRSTVLFGATINALATETHVLSSLRQLRTTTPPHLSHVHILGLTRNRHAVIFGRSCKDPHRHPQTQTSRKSDVSMQITQLCHPPSVTYGARCKSTVISNARTQASVPTWDRPTMLYFATCGLEYRTAQVLDTPDLVL